MAAHAVGAPGVGITLLRYLDLVVLALALPLFLAADLPMIGYAAGAGAWIVQRAIGEAAARRANASEDPRTVVGLLAGSMIARGWLTAGVIFTTGLVADREDGLAAAVLAIALFTVYFSANMVVRPFDAAGGRK
jgi:hypothetical protein